MDYKKKYYKYKHKYLHLKKQLGSSNLSGEELIKAKALSKYPFSFDDKCFYTLNNKKINEYAKEILNKHKYVYRGLHKKSIFKLTLEQLITEFTEKGGMSSTIAELSKRACMSLPTDLTANNMGMVNFIHATIDLSIASEFSVTQSVGVPEDGNGYIMSFDINEKKGIFLPEHTSSWDNEKEVAVPGILELEDLLWIVSVENFIPTKLWLNPHNKTKIIEWINDETENEIYDELMKKNMILDEGQDKMCKALEIIMTTIILMTPAVKIKNFLGIGSLAEIDKSKFPYPINEHSIKGRVTLLHSDEITRKFYKYLVGEWKEKIFIPMIEDVRKQLYEELPDS